MPLRRKVARAAGAMQSDNLRLGERKILLEGTFYFTYKTLSGHPN